MRFIIIVLTLFTTANIFGQKVDKLSDSTTYIKYDGYEGVIFSSDYQFFYPIDKRFTPTIDDIKKLEIQLKNNIKIINKEMPNQGKDAGPILHNNLNKYRRQYIGFINEKGEKVILVGMNWKMRSTAADWKENFLSIHDGGSYHWQIKFKVDKGEFYDFWVNGIG